MDDSTQALILHTVEAAHWTDAEATRDAIADAVPNLNVRLARTPPETRELLPETEVAIAASFPTELLEAAPELGWVQALSAGVDHYDLEAFQERNVVVTNVAGVHAEPIAEQVIGYLLAFERGLLEGMQMQERGVWERFGGGELRGKTLGIVGVGAIGSRIAEYGQAFGMEVIGTRRDPSEVPDAVDEIHAAENYEAFAGDGEWVNRVA